MVKIEVDIRIEVADIERAQAIHDSLKAQADQLAEKVQLITRIEEQILLNE